MSGELPEGMKPWEGGDSAPADWNGGKVFYRDRRTGLYPRDRPECWSHKYPSPDDIIGYTPMNPHQKPQEDVVVTQEDREAAGALDDALGFLTDIERPIVEQHLARHRLLGHEAGRRDMREEADEPLDYIDLFRIIRRAGRKDAAKAKAVYDAYAATISQSADFLVTEIVAWRERDGDEWVYYDADSDTGRHIAAHQRDRHNVSIFPLFAALPTEPLGGEG